MRLSREAAELIRHTTRAVLGPEVRIRLFGSRVDDTARGGDVDLLVESDAPIDRPAQLSARLSARLSRALGGRRVDVVFAAPNLKRLPIHDHARREGIAL